MGTVVEIYGDDLIGQITSNILVNNHSLGNALLICDDSEIRIGIGNREVTPEDLGHWVPIPKKHETLMLVFKRASSRSPILLLCLDHVTRGSIGVWICSRICGKGEGYGFAWLYGIDQERTITIGLSCYKSTNSCICINRSNKILNSLCSSIAVVGNGYICSVDGSGDVTYTGGYVPTFLRFSSREISSSSGDRKVTIGSPDI